jgi:porphobilinogen synthase
MRRLVRETKVSVDDLVYPLFVREGEGIKEPIKSMAGCFHFSPDTIAAEAVEVAALGIPAVLLRAIKEIKKAAPELLVITDVCLCEFTSHGHCGVVKDGKIKNDPTCELLAKMALSHAQAGADIVAPSDMMDGRVKYVREALEENGFENVAIMSYAAKYASAFYGPFRDAAESTPAFGDRRTYQMDAGNADQAMAEIALDIEEGADIVMVKPALAYLDIICRARQRFDCPIAAYNVSGEYMMVKSSAAAGLSDEEATMMEVLTAIKRAGADIIITYFAKDAAKRMQQ